jgi:hypothetical protein
MQQLEVSGVVAPVPQVEEAEERWESADHAMTVACESAPGM